jgi:hypothetical protein
VTCAHKQRSAGERASAAAIRVIARAGWAEIGRTGGGAPRVATAEHLKPARVRAFESARDQSPAFRPVFCGTSRVAVSPDGLLSRKAENPALCS